MYIMAATATIGISNITSTTIDVVVTAYSSGDTTGPWYVNIVSSWVGTTYNSYDSSWYSPDTIPLIGKTYTVQFSTLRYNISNPNTAFDQGALSRKFESPFYFHIYKPDGPESNPGTFTLTGSVAPYGIQIVEGAAPGGGGGGVACFTTGTQILTPTGYKAVEDIRTGDNVLTADARPVPVKSMMTTLVTNKETAPFLVPKGTFGLQHDLCLSPWHAFQIKKGLWMKPQTASELCSTVEQYDVGKQITYYHLETPNYFKDNLVTNGTIVESFANQQLKNIATRPYKYNATLKAYTRMSEKPTKALTQ